MRILPHPGTRLLCLCAALLLLSGGCATTQKPLYRMGKNARVPTADSFVYPVENYRKHVGQPFYKNGTHLGEDVTLPAGTPVRAIANGRIVCYRKANGYGELVVSIVHDLGTTKEFRLRHGHKKTARTRYLISIYGHLRPCRERGGKSLGWKEGDVVRKGQIIGYVNDARHNGRGTAHLHMGMRLTGYNGTWVFFGSARRGTGARSAKNVNNWAACSEVLGQLPR